MWQTYCGIISFGTSKMSLICAVLSCYFNLDENEEKWRNESQLNEYSYAFIIDYLVLDALLKTTLSLTILVILT